MNKKKKFVDGRKIIFKKIIKFATMQKNQFIKI